MTYNHKIDTILLLHDQDLN